MPWLWEKIVKRITKFPRATNERMRSRSSVNVAHPGIARSVRSRTPTTAIDRRSPAEKAAVKAMRARTAIRSISGEHADPVHDEAEEAHP